MTRLLLTSPGEKTVCADRDDRGGVLLTVLPESEQIYLTWENAIKVAILALDPDPTSGIRPERGFWHGFRTTGYFLWLPTGAAMNLMGVFADTPLAPLSAALAIACGLVFAWSANEGHYDETVAELRASFGFSPRQSPTAERDARA